MNPTTEKALQKIIEALKNHPTELDIPLQDLNLKIRVMKSGNMSFRVEDLETEKLVAQFSLKSITSKKYALGNE